MAESITQNTAYRAVMELKTYTITIHSGKSGGESQTYTASHGSSWSFPSCPFSPDSGKAFRDYTLNGSTYSAGSSVTVTSDISITCNWVLTNPVGKSLQVRCYKTRAKGAEFELLSYDPDLEGMDLRGYIPGDYMSFFENTLRINSANINSRHLIVGTFNIIANSSILGQILPADTNFIDADKYPYQFMFQDTTTGMYDESETGPDGVVATLVFKNPI